MYGWVWLSCFVCVQDVLNLRIFLSNYLLLKSIQRNDQIDVRVCVMLDDNIAAEFNSEYDYQAIWEDLGLELI